ncbi:hypothetical protein ACSDR0_43985 [Streptosporangium sp. G11]
MTAYEGDAPLLPGTPEPIVIGVVAFAVLFAAVALVTLVIVVPIKLLRDS